MTIFTERKRLRREKYDYSSSWTYFVTICTKHKEHFFWEIKNKHISFSRQWIICQAAILSLPYIRNTIHLYESIVMPNHIHLLFHMQNPTDCVQASIRSPEETVNTVSYTTQTLWSVIWNFKAMVTRKCNENNLPFAWHRSYHDRIVRDQRAYDNISHYICTNAERRHDDTFNW